MFQGAGRKDDYFEGWYFKLVDEGLENIFAVIPGVSIKGRESHCFVQLLEGRQAASSYFKFPFQDFSYQKDSFRISIGDNIFSSRKMQLDIEKDGRSLKADIGFKDRISWPSSFFSPGAMGWYSFVPFMECYHGVISMDHTLAGSMEIDGKTTRLTGGKGYIEKDWGSSFPRGWIWLQCNNFDKNDPCSLMVSIARIPWRGRSFTGFICGLLAGRDFYVFATYNGAVLKDISYGKDYDKIRIVISRGDLRLEIDAGRKKSAELASPVMGAMEGRINEGLDSVIRVGLFRKDKNVITDTGRCGGLEIVDPEVLDI